MHLLERSWPDARCIGRVAAPSELVEALMFVVPDASDDAAGETFIQNRNQAATPFKWVYNANRLVDHQRRDRYSLVAATSTTGAEGCATGVDQCFAHFVV